MIPGGPVPPRGPPPTRPSMRMPQGGGPGGPMGMRPPGPFMGGPSGGMMRPPGGPNSNNNNMMMAGPGPGPRGYGNASIISSPHNLVPTSRGPNTFSPPGQQQQQQQQSFLRPQQGYPPGAPHFGGMPNNNNNRMSMRSGRPSHHPSHLTGGIGGFGPPNNNHNMMMMMSSPNNPNMMNNMGGPPHQMLHSQQKPPFMPTGGQRKPFGTLTIKFIKGINLKAGQGVFGKADPYLKVKLVEGREREREGREKDPTKSNKSTWQKCKPDMQGGKNPEWNETFEFEILSEKFLEIEVMDKETVGNDKLMGKASAVNILDWIAQGTFQGEVEIEDRGGKPCGKIEIQANFTRFNPYENDSTNNNNGEETDNRDKKTSNKKSKMLGDTGSLASTAPKKLQDDLPNSRNPNDNFSDDEIYEAFHAFDLDNNSYVGAAEIRHVLVNIGERVSDEEVDEMIRMVDHDGDGQVCFSEFYKMITGGKKMPHSSSTITSGGNQSQQQPQKGGGSVSSSTSSSQPISIPTGQAVVQARNEKRKALSDFATDNNLKPESVKRAHRRFVIMDQKKSGVMDYTEFCEILQVDPTPQSEDVFKKYDYNKSGLIDAKELLIALANFTGAGKEDK